MNNHTRLRIFVVLPMYGGSLPIGRYCIKTLQEMGHVVGIFNAPVLYNAYLGLKKLDMSPEQIAKIEDQFLKLVSQALSMQIDSFKPDFVLALAQAPINSTLLRKLRQENIKSVMWFVEDYKLFTYWKVLAPLYDAFAVIQKEPFISKLESIGQKNVLYLPLAAHPNIHKKLTLTNDELKEFSSDIGFLGAGYPNRRIAFRQLADKKFKIWGSDWENETILGNNIQRNGERISEEESVKIYNATKININLHSSIHTNNLVSGGDFVNPRTFELASIGAFQLVDKRSLLSELFAEDELATFNTLAEMYSKLDYYLEHEEERNQLSKKSRERVLKDHTYEKRMRTLITFMEDKFGPLSKKEINNLLDSCNPLLRSEIEKVLTKLNIPYNTSFEELLFKLRNQKGKLNEIEMALLFIDEFAKQYRK